MKKIGHFQRIRVFNNGNSVLLYGLLVGLIGTILVFIIYFGGATFGSQLQEGDVVLQSVYAPFDFGVKGDVDEFATNDLRQKIMDGVNPIYDLNLIAAKQKTEKITKLIQMIYEIQKIQEATLVEKLNQFSEKLKTIELALSHDEMETLLTETDLTDWSNRLNQSLETLLALGILSAPEKKKLLELRKREIVIQDSAKNQETVKSISEILDVEESKSKIEYIVYDHFPESRKSRSAAIEILTQLVVPSLIYNREEMEKREKLAADTIQPVHKHIEIKKNQLIVGKGQKINRKHLAIFKTMEQEGSLISKLGNVIGILLLVFLLIAVFIFYLKQYEPHLLRQPSNLALLGIIAILTTALAKGVTFLPFSNFLIPIPMAGMLTTILVSSATGIMITLLLILLVATVVAQKFNLILVMVLSGLTGVYFVNRIHRRSDILKAGLWSGVAGAVGILIASLISGLQIRVSINEAGWGILNGILCAILVMGILPAFEVIFKITTNPSLLELSDLNHSLLRQLAIHAPGTYHHSLVVGNLAESACETIEANALLARVGAYYHDIGKIEKAEYFTENQTDSISRHRHEKLSPHMSSLIIVSHIKNGVEMAKQYKLPDRIIDFVPEHQGTSLIYFFYQKALQHAKEGESIKEEDFRYPGPKPQSKETAVVLLADSVEAASRSLTEPTPARIKGLVRKIINNKFIDGQLDECNLTLRDLNAIAESFVRVLTGIFHTRVPYPEPKEPQGYRGYNSKGNNVYKDRKSSENGQSKSG